MTTIEAPTGPVTVNLPPPGPLRPAGRLRGTLAMPSDKSIAQRGLIFASLAEGVSELILRDPGADVLSAVGALRGLGVDVEQARAGDALRIVVAGLGDGAAVGRLGSGSADCGNSGTTIRLLAGALAAGQGVARLTGDASLSRRPMERVAGPLRAMGADVRTTDGHAPLTVVGVRALDATAHRLPTPSAQVLGAICLAALAAEGRTTVRVPPGTRDHTERLLGAMGAAVARQTDGGGTLTSVEGPAGLHGLALRVPADFSSAAAWTVAASIHPDAELRLAGVGLNPTRTALVDVLRAMGADITLEQVADDAAEPVGDIVVRSAGRLRATAIAAPEVAALVDELPLLAVAMAAAEGTSEVRGASELRLKESDRIGALAAALAAAGAEIEELPDGWRIRRGRPRTAEFATGGDHRIAIALAVAAWSGLAAGVTLDDPACVGVSYPSVWRDAAIAGALR